MRRSPEIEKLVRRYMSSPIWEHEGLYSESPDFLSIGTDDDEWAEGFDAYLALSQVQTRELEAHLSGPPLPPTVTRLRAFELGRVGWAAATISWDLGGSIAPVSMRSTWVLLFENGQWRIVHMHHSLPAPTEEWAGVELTRSLDTLVSSLDVPHGEEIAAVLPSGTATVMFTDIEDSTLIAQAIGDEAWARVVRSHFQEVGRIVEREDGTVVKTLGDGGMFAFPSARSALTAAVGVQRAAQKRSDTPELAIRVGLHSGDVLRVPGDYIGLTVHKAARVAAAASGGEIVASAVTAELAGGSGFQFGDSMTLVLKGIEGTHRVVSVLWD